MKKSLYERYTKTEPITISMKTLFTDSDGFPNENAFRNFIEQIKEGEEYYLICINIDLTASNESKGYAFGTRVLRKVYLQLKNHFCIFRVNGDKFNLLVEKDDIDNAEMMLNSDTERLQEMFSIYYGIVRDTPITMENYTELRNRGKDLMYQDKARKTNKQFADVRDDKIVGDKGNTPLDLQETDTHKHRETMWYGTVDFAETKPTARKLVAHVFPTEFKEKLASLNMIVVVDDLLNPRLYTGNNVTFGFDGIKVTITSRFDNEGHLNIVCFQDRETTGECEMVLQVHEGNCIPASFGKRLTDGREVYPVKPNNYGTYDYVLWDEENNTANLVTTGIVEMDGKTYAVHADVQGIDLIEQ
jgi:GGDEF domain-containing protein